MTNEAVLIFETGPPIPFTVADAGIEMGTLLTMSDPMTAAANSTKESIVGGIAASEKIASDENLKLGVYRQGIFKVTASGSITVGDALISASGAAGSEGNKLETSGTSVEDIVGISLESATDGQTFLMELRPVTINVA